MAAAKKAKSASARGSSARGTSAAARGTSAAARGTSAAARGKSVAARDSSAAARGKSAAARGKSAAARGSSAAARDIAAAVPVEDPIQKRDGALRAIVEANPHDDDAVSVYSDWLEEQGDEARATFLRLQQQLRDMRVSHPKLLERGRELYAVGEKLDSEWVSAVTYPKLAGTAWDGADDDGPLTWRFLPNGFINYTQPSGTFENGKWIQIGVTVAMETNAHYADYFGVIVDNVIRGNAFNIVDHKWRWKVTLTEDPKLAATPENVNRTIHDDHVRQRAKKKSGKRKRVKGPVVVTLTRNKPPARGKPLTRKQPLVRKTKLAARPITRRTGKPKRA